MRERASAAAADNAGGDALLRIRDLQVRFDRGKGAFALQGVDLDVHPSEIVAVVGESGSGKSTLGLAIQGLLPEASQPQITGSIRLHDTEIVGASSATTRDIRKHQVRAIFQDPMSSLNPTMRIGRQLQEACTSDVSPVEWLGRVSITEPERRLRAFPHQLSGGQRQRVMIAMAMAANPALVVADEPTTALDVTVQTQVLKLIARLRDEHGAAFLFITHDLAVASAIADRLLVLYNGRVVEIGPAAEVTALPAHPYSVALLNARFGIDVDRSQQLPTLPGEPPGSDQTISGCSFAPRCVIAEPRCHTDQPALAAVAQHSGTAACHRSDAVTPQIWDRTVTGWPSHDAASDDGVLVDITGVSKSFTQNRFGRRNQTRSVALQQVDLQIHAGESIALVGESGSGKTTLLRVVAGLTPPDSGEVRFCVEDEPQMVYQDAYGSLTPWLTVGDLVGERLRRRGIARATRNELVEAALVSVGLNPSLAKVRPPYLSGGQRQRVAIARATVVPPRLLLCDEPISAVDVSMAAAMLNLLQELRLRLGMAMMFVTHDIAAARFVADRIIVMKDGEVVETGEADVVTHRPTESYTQRLLEALPSAPGGVGG